MTSKREDLNSLPAMRVGGEPNDEADHFIVCPTSGQAVDMRKLGDVFYHDEPDHEPLPTHRRGSKTTSRTPFFPHQ